MAPALPALDPKGRLRDGLREELAHALGPKEIELVNQVIETWDEEESGGKLDAELADLERRVRAAITGAVPSC